MGTDRSRIRVLLAENPDRDHRLLLALAHGQGQVNVTVADSAAACIQALDVLAYDCAVIDYRLPDGDAADVVDAVALSVGASHALIVCDRAEDEHAIRGLGLASISSADARDGDALWRCVERLVAAGSVDGPPAAPALSTSGDDAAIGTGALCDRHVAEHRLAARRWSGRPSVCAMVDLHCNDTEEGSAGRGPSDHDLESVASLIAPHLTAADVMCLWSTAQVLVCRDSASVLDEWLWAESLRQQIETIELSSGGLERGLSATIGLSRGEAGADLHDVVVRAGEALLLARRRGWNTVCTDDMVDVSRALDEVAGMPEGPEARRIELIRRLDRTLGPTQWAHITDHCVKVSRLAVDLAELMKLPEVEVERVRVAGLMHDIGKCVIPEQLLAKPRSLTAQEWHLMARHDDYGVWITERLGIDEQTIRYIQNHHQRYDASLRSGPDQEEETGLDGARILCVADALVTMLTNRSYRAAMSRSHALAELRRQSGRQFDPDVVDAIHYRDDVVRAIAA